MDNFDRPGRIATRMEAFIYFSIKISENFGKMKITRYMYDNWVVDIALSLSHTMIYTFVRQEHGVWIKVLN